MTWRHRPGPQLAFKISADRIPAGELLILPQLLERHGLLEALKNDVGAAVSPALPLRSGVTLN